MKIGKAVKWILSVIKRRGLTFIIGFAFALLCFVALNAAMEPVSKSEYCGTKCHEMGAAYQSWKLSVHSANPMGLRAECIDCHLPPKDKYLTHIVVKAYEGGKDMYKHYFGGEYDVEKVRERVLEHTSNEKCLVCHVDLLAKPGSEIAKELHMESLNSPEESENRCVDCHEDAGHQR
jgi:cytochrome c-type protein NapC/trimethylamine-N-oxide reductase cytochrome c-type subunit TorC